MAPSAGVERLVARCSFPPPGTEVSCAVSGGADSLALLVLAVEAGCRVTAIHVDHGLRPGSAAEAEVVAAAAQRFGAGFIARTVEVAAGPNLEERAREARRGVLPPDVLTGHTADDQAETLLLALVRGAGWTGLGAMQPDRRPLLDLRRTETRSLCETLGLVPVEDPMNADRRFARTRIRHDVLPALSEAAGRDVVPTLVRAAALLRAGGGVLDELAAELDPTDARAVAAAHELIARTAIRCWVRDGWDSHHPPDLAAVDRVLCVARCEARATDIGRGWRVRRSGQRLSLVAPTG
ncbi:MAG: tRNA lysidine(34) synthetase TilS [Acidimicrobiales bacterium]|nr:tRNA lysidine(34) synthetase TilS [Acidimicrobiales bacterium]